MRGEDMGLGGMWYERHGVKGTWSHGGWGAPHILFGSLRLACNLYIYYNAAYDVFRGLAFLFFANDVLSSLTQLPIEFRRVIRFKSRRRKRRRMKRRQSHNRKKQVIAFLCGFSAAIKNLYEKYVASRWK